MVNLGADVGEDAKENRKTTMLDEYNFNKAKRGAVIPSQGKTRITIILDDDVIAAFRARGFRARGDPSGKGYQTAINAALRASIDPGSAPVTLRTLRAVLNERRVA